MSEPTPTALTLSAAQQQIDASIQSLGGYWPPLANLARLFEECGEVARAVNQLQGSKKLKLGEIQANLSEEIGDALYTLLVLANSLDVDVEKSLTDVLAKYQRRDVSST